MGGWKMGVKTGRRHETLKQNTCLTTGVASPPPPCPLTHLQIHHGGHLGVAGREEYVEDEATSGVGCALGPETRQDIRKTRY